MRCENYLKLLLQYGYNFVVNFFMKIFMNIFMYMFGQSDIRGQDLDSSDNMKVFVKTKTRSA